MTDETGASLWQRIKAGSKLGIFSSSAAKEALQIAAAEVTGKPAPATPPPSPALEAASAKLEAIAARQRVETAVAKLREVVASSKAARGIVQRPTAQVASAKPLSTDTPAGFAAASELEFPYPPKGAGRNGLTFLSMTAAEVQQVAELAEDEREGRAIRQELVDALDGFTPLDAQMNRRSEFVRKFQSAFHWVSRYGPREATPNDPAPPMDPNAPDARDLLNLSKHAKDELNALAAREQQRGRLVRAELKRAYRAASSADRYALIAEFGGALKAYPNEPV